MNRVRVAVVFGGRNSEHGVSLLGAGGVLAAIDREKYEPVPVGIARDGRWVLPSERQQYAVEAAVSGDAELVLPFGGSDLLVLEPGAVPKTLGEVDVVLPVLHGAYAEDGTIQGLLEMAGVAYAGSGVLASAVGMDKEYMKLVLAGRGLPTCRYVVIRDRDWNVSRARKLEEAAALGFPVFVKPARAGSSQGVTRADTPQELEEAIELAREHDPKVLVEEAVIGREVECAVLESLDPLEPPQASEVGEIITDGHEFYDFEAKYLGESPLQAPAALPPDLRERLRSMAVEAFDALSCEGLARVDFFLTPSGELILNEINTMPGFTPNSVAPELWARSGLPYPDLVDRLIQLALRRRRSVLR